MSLSRERFICPCMQTDFFRHYSGYAFPWPSMRARALIRMRAKGERECDNMAFNRMIFPDGARRTGYALFPGNGWFVFGGEGVRSLVCTGGIFRV